MKTRYFFAAFLMLLGLVSCDKFLDTLPDNRTDLDSKEKIRNLLITAYPGADYLGLNEMMSDNTDHLGDNNPYMEATYCLAYEQAYKWMEVTEDNWGCSSWVWEYCYGAIAAANQALLAIEEHGGVQATGMQAEQAEALLCRAFSHFILVNTFCQHYTPETAETELGIPYMKHAETSLNPKYERGTVAQVYQSIDEDLKAALPYVSDVYYAVPQYHFTIRAAYAFAARFYLFYQNWPEAERCASIALGVEPQLRDYEPFAGIPTEEDLMCDQFISPSEKANLLVLGSNSLYARVYGYPYGYCEKYAHSRYTAINEDCLAANIWGNTAGISASSLYNLRPLAYKGNGFDKVFFTRAGEYFKLDDATSGTGIPYVFFPGITIEEALLTRAEARILRGSYDQAAEDLTLWMQNTVKTTKVLTPEVIWDFYKDHEVKDASGNPVVDENGNPVVFTYATWDKSSIKKHLNPAFNIGAENELRECMIQCVLGFRRIEGLDLGLRWWDVKRYGIEIWRRTLGPDGNPIRLDDVLKKDDLRRAVQLPPLVIAAGLEANPRNK